jgi:glycosyltransferase involved in cell wall biosynthesis
MKLRIEKSAVVITPSIGNDSLTRALESVAKQTYKNLKHLVVSDGPEFLGKVESKCEKIDSHIITTSTPVNTGASGFYGHRIYASYPHLVNEDYILFLDEDNWYEPNHVQTLIEKIESDKLDWAYSLRNVYLSKDKFLDQDCCESIGKWPIWFSVDQHLVDTSSYCFTRPFITSCCSNWHHGWGGDRRFYHIIKSFSSVKYDTTGQHTLNYILPDMNKAYGGDFEFFKKGNAEIMKKYGGKYPWK